mmetsp:Transcript_22642/g.52263  ORF Transcript_22642/g.52263 Transcript_22642/m.52263 type:complete len:144 (+) Transcript_22642:1941-2372(+)
MLACLIVWFCVFGLQHGGIQTSHPVECIFKRFWVKVQNADATRLATSRRILDRDVFVSKTKVSITGQVTWFYLGTVIVVVLHYCGSSGIHMHLSITTILPMGDTPSSHDDVVSDMANFLEIPSRLWLTTPTNRSGHRSRRVSA